MNYPDTSVIMILFILPSLFGFILIGEGVSKIIELRQSWLGWSIDRRRLCGRHHYRLLYAKH